MNLESEKRKKYDQIVFWTKLAILIVAKANRIPEKAILNALERAKAEDWPTGGWSHSVGLPEHTQRELAKELLVFCSKYFPEDAVLYLEESVTRFFGRKPPQEASTKIWALYYWYLKEAGIMQELHSGNGKKKALAERAQQHGISEQNLFQVFNAVGRNSDKNPLKVDILEKVVPLLTDYPQAQALAIRDLEKIQKRTEE